MSSFRLFAFLVVTLLGSLPASASLLTAYNVVVTGNFNAIVHVEGATFVGGNLTSAQMSEFNHKGLTPAGYSGLRVAGKIDGTLKVMHNETVEYKNKTGNSSITCSGANCATSGVDLSGERSDLAAQMATMSAAYSSLAANGVYSQGKLSYAGAGSTAVFNVAASDLFFQNSNLQLVLGNATRAVINVTGNVDVFNTNLSGAWNGANVLWNFTNATTVNFKDMAVKGQCSPRKRSCRTRRVSTVRCGPPGTPTPVSARSTASRTAATCRPVASPSRPPCSWRWPASGHSVSGRGASALRSAARTACAAVSTAAHWPHRR